jgi:GNAT superfamily N-acetyltransferase
MHRNFMTAAERVVHPGYPSARVEVGPWLLVDAGRPDHPNLNGATVVTEASPGDLAVAEEWFAERGSRCMFKLRRDTDGYLISTLLERGYAVNRREPALYQESPKPPSYEGPLEIVEIASMKQLDRFLASDRAPPPNDFLEAFSRKEMSIPGFIEYFGLVDGKPVGAASSLTSGSIVGIYAVGVEESYRRRGFGTALTWAAVAGGLKRGATSAWLGSTEMSHSIYQRMGFSLLYEYLKLDRQVECPPRRS